MLIFMLLIFVGKTLFQTTQRSSELEDNCIKIMYGSVYPHLSNEDPCDSQLNSRHTYMARCQAVKSLLVAMETRSGLDDTSILTECPTTSWHAGGATSRSLCVPGHQMLPWEHKLGLVTRELCLYVRPCWDGLE